MTFFLIRFFLDSEIYGFVSQPFPAPAPYTELLWELYFKFNDKFNLEQRKKGWCNLN